MARSERSLDSVTPMVERTAAALMVALDLHADEAYAANLHWFFKAEAGGYGEGDQFLGLRVPLVRQVCRPFRGLPTGELGLLLASPWHEHRLAAAILMATDYPRSGDERRADLYALLLASTHRLNNWDLVDQCAPYVVGAHLDVVGGGVLDELAGSPLLWERRIAMVSTWWRIRRGESADALRIAARLLGDEHPLIHKAVGWMLREVGKRVGEADLIAFLDVHAGQMPAVMLSYATERMSAEQRLGYRALRRR
jgi:DNA alkylation repair enzyme